MIRFALFLCRLILSLRYRIEVKGYQKLKEMGIDRGVVFLANHPAEVDPLILSMILWGRYRPRPVAADFVFHLPLIRLFVAWVGTIPIPGFDLTTNSFKKKRIEETYQKISALIKGGGSVLIYPAGMLKVGAKEVIGGASGTYELLKRTPEAQVVLIRTTGLWGSTLSKAVTARSPDMLAGFLYGIKSVCKNFFFFTPRRSVLVEIEAAPADFPRTDKQKMNRYLEEWFNRNGPEELKLVSFSFWKREVPAVVPQQVEKKFTLSSVPQEIQKRVLEEVSALTKIPVDQLHPDQDFAQDLGLDSLDKAQLALVLREQFGVYELNSSELTTIESMMAFAARLKEGAKEDEVAVVKKSVWGIETGRPLPSYPDCETLIEGFLDTSKRLDRLLAAADVMAGEVSYRRLRLGVVLFARYIQQLPGEKIGIMLPASVAADVALLAVQLAGKVPVMINWTLGERNLRSVVEQTGIETTLSSWKFLDRLSNTELGPLDDQMVLLEEVRFSFSLKQKLQAWWLARKETAALMRIFGSEKLDQQATAVILFTSGTESFPKGVPLSHRNVMENQRAAAQLISLQQDDVMVGVLPPFHSFGFSVTGVLPLIAGLRVVYSPNPTHGRQIAYCIKQWKGTLFCSAPTFLKNLLRVAQKEHLRTLRLVVTGAERMPEALRLQLKELNPKAELIEGYGITECAPILTLNPPGFPPSGVGHPLPNVTLKIVSPETYEEVQRGESGLILASGPNIFSGYLGGESPPFRTIQGEQWYETGDLGTLDAQGCLTLEGRLKRFIKIGGEMVSLTMIEEVLQQAAVQHRWKISEEAPSFAVVASEQESEKSAIHLFTVCKLSIEEVNRALRAEGMSNLIKVQSVHTLFALPLLGSGKIDYRALAAKLESKTV